MSYDHAGDTAALREELASVRARQEVLHEALGLAGDELDLLRDQAREDYRKINQLRAERNFLLTEVETLRAKLDEAAA